jgi:C4-dicarboxylate-specific signal transduction histidine kinase
LILLADPFDDAHGFHPELVVPTFEDLERRVKEAYFDEAELRLVATLDGDGHASAQVTDWKGETLYRAEHGQLTKSGPYEAPQATFELWVFLLDSQSFASRTATLPEVRQWLDVVGGVHLYHRGLRVHPYGDPGHDWLEMNLARARSPELRPSTNTSIGRVTVSDPDERLLQKTDRTGFVENDAFTDLRRFAIDSLDWMSRQRLRTREDRRQRTRVTTGRSLQNAQRQLTQSVQALPAESRQTIEAAVGRLEKVRERESVALREEVQLYRTLATVGTTAAVFSHESAKPITQIETMTDRLESRARDALGPAFDDTLRKPIALIRSSVRALRSFASLPRQLLQRDKRRAGRVDVHAVITEISDLFQPFLEKAGIATDLQLVEDAEPQILGSNAAVESIVANLLTNSINAFAAPGARTSARRLVLRTEISGSNLLLRVLDNGPGIRDLDPDEVWLPGRTTVPGGTGLGLTIVRDAATDLGGKCRAIAAGELGGAEFAIEIPLSSVQ